MGPLQSTTTKPAPASNGGGQAPARDINGRKLAAALKNGTVQPDFAAWLAFKLQSGEAHVHHLTAKQARALTGASRAGLAAERRKNRRANGNGGNGKQERLFYRRSPSDTDLDAAVAQHGPRLMAALDRATKPRCDATSEMFTR
jgi:hypothetical protein